MKRVLLIMILSGTVLGFLFLLPRKKNFRPHPVAVSSSVVITSDMPLPFTANSQLDVLDGAAKGSKGLDVFGEDTNGDGLWDDVEESVLKLGKTLDQKKALAFTLRTYQRAIEHPEDGTLIKEEKIKNYIMQSNACEEESFAGAIEPSSDLVAQLILNNNRRTKQYLKFMENLSGSFMSLWREEKDGKPCPF